MNWHTVAVYYYDDNKDDLVLDAVRPLFDALPPAVTGAYFARHWRRGPHLRLNFRTGRAALPDGVLPAVENVVGGFLARRPSTAVLDAAELLPEHRRLAETEQEPGPLWPWRPDNSVHVEPYDDRAHVLGGQRAAGMLADFYTSTTRHAFDATQAVRDGRRQRLWLAFELMIATAHGFAAGGLGRGYLSFRAHAEVFLARTGAADRWRAGWDASYAAAAPALRERLTGLVSAIDRGRAAGTPYLQCPPAVAGWLSALAGFRRHCYPLVDSGELQMDGAPAGQQAPPGASPFLRELITNREFHERVLPSSGFRRYRLLLNLLYLQLTRLGVRPVDRYLLAHFAANATEELYGIDPVAQLRANVRLGS